MEAVSLKTTSLRITATSVSYVALTGANMCQTIIRCVFIQVLLKKNPNCCSPCMTSEELVTYQKKNLPGCSGYTLVFEPSLFSSSVVVYSILFPLFLLQVLHWNLQRRPVKDPGRRWNQGHDGGSGLRWQGENLLGGLSLPPEGPWDRAAVRSAQRQRLEPDIFFRFLFSYPHLSDLLMRAAARAVCAGMEKHGRKRLSRDQRVSFICPANRSTRLQFIIPDNNRQQLLPNTIVKE